jgi:nitrite reductase/ring-hydroxylating ferredoxin subunit
MTSTIEAEVEQQSSGTLWDPVDGHHSCWYPIALSDDVGPGQLKGMELCDGKIVLYRGEDGVARVTTAFCPHMGANLSFGQVVGNDLQCAFHHWQFAPDGHCSLIPSGDRIPKMASVFAFPVEEKWGIIWVFFGREPLYPVPSFPNWDEDKYVTRASRIKLSEPLMVDPWIFGTNLFDFQHFQVVHEVPGLNPDITWHEWGGEWIAEVAHPVITNMTMQARMWGVNSLVSRSVRGDEELSYLIGMTPLGKEGLSPFICAAAEKGDGAEVILDQQLKLHTELIQEDVRIMNSIELGEAMFSSSDRSMVRYLRYVRDFPRAHMKDFLTHA